MSEHELLNRVIELTTRVNEYEHRIQQIMDYLESTDTASFSYYSTYKLIHHIRKGEGWL